MMRLMQQEQAPFGKMKLWVLCLVSILWGGATTTLLAQKVKIPPYPVTLHQKGSNLDRVFSAIQAQCAARFSYDKIVAQNTPVAAVDYTNTPLNEVLGHLKQFARLSYMAEGNNIVVQIGRKLRAQLRDTTLVAGKVVDDETGDPVVNATVKIGEQLLMSNEEGRFAITLPWGSYIAEISSVGYGTKKVDDIRTDKLPYLELSITLARQKGTLADVVVTSSARKEGIAAHFLRQKNAASLTDGISSEQIARTPDNNMGQVLKRITGVATISDRYVMVRGLGDRYNQGMIDGIVVPSTRMNRRDFSFDAIPQEVVSNVVVNKTATPDVSAEFSGGQISVNTLDIPNANFTTIGLGIGYNDQGTGRDFYRLGRWGKYDFMGFDDGSRKMPANIITWQPGGDDNELPPPGTPQTVGGHAYDGDKVVPYNSFDAIAQSRRIGPEGLRLYRYTALPLYNGRLALGRVYAIGRDLAIGFTAGLSLRNNQTVVNFNNVRGAEESNNPLDTVAGTRYKLQALHGTGTAYRHVSSLGSLLNVGIRGQHFRLALKNVFTSTLNDEYGERLTYDFSQMYNDPFRNLFQQPELTQVRQHLLEGAFMLPLLDIDYGVSITKIRQEVRDQRILNYRLTTTLDNVDYYETAVINNPAEAGTGSQLDVPQRLWTKTNETDYNWKLSLRKTLGEHTPVVSLLKVGYNGWYKNRPLETKKLNIYATREGASAPFLAPYESILQPENMGLKKGQAYYWAEALNSAVFEGTLRNQALYLMADQKFYKKFRFIYGLRAEYFNLSQKDDDFLKKRYNGEVPDWAYRVNYFNGKELKEKDWRLLPSANLVYGLTPKINIRGAYGRTAIRPDFRESSYFGMYDYELNATVTGKKLVSTLVDNIDVRFEWYPGATEILTIGGFYKHMDKPIELMADPSTPTAVFYRFVNQDYARNYGVEMEFRKSLEFMAPAVKWMQHLIFFGNGSIINSRVVQSTYPRPIKVGDKEAWAFYTDSSVRQRPLIGQVPWLANAGVMYQGELWGITASYNRTGYRTNLVAMVPNQDEYEGGRNLLDLQFYGRFFKQKMEIKLNMGNLLNEYRFFYQNLNGYKQEGSAGDQKWVLYNGTLAYEKDKGDRITYREKTGRNFSVAVTYKF